jgi:hypothetical protein
MAVAGNAALPLSSNVCRLTYCFVKPTQPRLWTLVRGLEATYKLRAVSMIASGCSDMETQTVVFVGNCQLGTLASLFRQFALPDAPSNVVYLPSYESATPEQLRTAAAADIVLHQILDFVPKIGEFETRAAVHFVPHVTGAFLWPCAGQSHPKNQPHLYSDPSGPYNAELGDSVLNRMILDNVDPDEAVIRFMNTDIAALRRVDRMKEIILEKQRARDLLSGYRFADFIDGCFRTRRLFRSQNHPEMPLTLLLASEVFGRLGVDSGTINRMNTEPPGALFPPTETPLHPSIISHFGLCYADVNSRYRFYDEGSFTCSEYARRYMNYEWNPLLGAGYEQANSGHTDTAIQTLTRAVEISPRSPSGRSVLSDLLATIGAWPEALVFAGQALELDPQNIHYKNRLEHISSQIKGET